MTRRDAATGPRPCDIRSLGLCGRRVCCRRRLGENGPTSRRSAAVDPDRRSPTVAVTRRQPARPDHAHVRRSRRDRRLDAAPLPAGRVRERQPPPSRPLAPIPRRPPARRQPRRRARLLRLRAVWNALARRGAQQRRFERTRSRRLVRAGRPPRPPRDPLLANGLDVPEAVLEGQEFSIAAIAHAQRLGMGKLVPDRYFWAREGDAEEDGANGENSANDQEPPPVIR